MSGAAIVGEAATNGSPFALDQVEPGCWYWVPIAVLVAITNSRVDPHSLSSHETAPESSFVRRWPISDSTCSPESLLHRIVMLRPVYDVSLPESGVIVGQIAPSLAPQSRTLFECESTAVSVTALTVHHGGTRHSLMKIQITRSRDQCSNINKCDII